MADRHLPEKAYYGAAYYPEVWPMESVSDDIKRMTELSINVVRMAEFAWVQMEPREGEYCFDWLHRVIDQLHTADIDVILGTPTATPPAWLATEHPEIFCVDEDRVRRTHGARRNCDYNCDAYLKYSEAIVTELAEEFGCKPGVVAWQTDNELGLSESFSSQSEEAWHRWLEQRYGTISALNEAWGTEPWSQRYDSFDQIPMGTKRVSHHPSLRLSWYRFTTDSACRFQQLQIDAIRKHSDLPITHNTMPGQKIDYYALCKDLDFVSVDCYHDYQYYWRIASNYDRMRGFGKGPHILMETAPNNSGGATTWLIHPLKGSVRAAIFMNHALGGQGSLYWLFRQHRSAQEMTHGSIISAWGEPTVNYPELAQIGSELQRSSAFLLQNPVPKAQIGIVYDHESHVGLTIEPYINGKQPYYAEWSERFYRPLQDAHLHRDVIPQDADFRGYKVIVAPMLPYVSEGTVLKLKEFVEAGGTLILGPMTGYRDQEWTAHTDHGMGRLEDWMGIAVEARVPLGGASGDDARVELEFEDGSRSPVTLFGDTLRTDTGRVLAKYRGGLVDSANAIILSDVGLGRVLLLGTDPGPTKLEELYRSVSEECGIQPVITGDKGVISVPRSRRDDRSDSPVRSGTVLVSISSDERRVCIKDPSVDILTGREVKGEIAISPYEVLILHHQH